MARPAKPMFPPVPSAGETVAEGLWTLKSAAADCDVSVDEIERAIARGALEVIYWGRLRMVARSQVKALQAGLLERARAERGKA